MSRALRVLEVVASTRDGVRAKELAAQLAMPLPTVYRLLSTLVGRDTSCASPTSTARRSATGSGCSTRACTVSSAVGDEVAEAVGRLHVEADAAAYYAAYRGVDVVVAHVVDSIRRPRVQILDVGFHEATHATAFGKVMLSGMSAEERDCCLDAFGSSALTAQPITDRETLVEHLRHAGDAGIALEVNEFQPGLTCMAAPVRSPAGRIVGSVAMSLASKPFATRRWDF